MTGPAIKICGVTSAEALDAAIAARADHVGFNFHPGSPRWLNMRDASALSERAAQRIGCVGLFVDAGDAAIVQAIEAGRLSALQLHGSETPQRCAEVRARFGVPVWKAIPVAAAADVTNAHAYRNAADVILFDARTPPGTLRGGMGLVFDWTLLAGWDGALPWGLAGGLTPTNVAGAIRATGAPLVDVSSGVESAPGIKVPERIDAFCHAARAG